ncbi:MAG: Integrator complex subunit 11, partial [Paramarteilia canceri]
RKFPDFSFISNSSMSNQDDPSTDLTGEIDCVLISHFHLDHCGALPYLTEMVGYSGPIYMTSPTKSMCPMQLVFSVFLQYNKQLGGHAKSSHSEAQR